MSNRPLHWNWLRSTMNAGRSRACLTSLKRICSSVDGQCAARPLIWCAKNFTAGCWHTTQCAGLCTRRLRNMKCCHENYLLWRMLNCCAEHNPSLGPFPPAHPRLRKRWFVQLLAHAAVLLCVSSRGKTNPRMVKRRNTPFASHNRTLKINRRQIFIPVLLPPMPLTKRKWYSQAKST